MMNRFLLPLAAFGLLVIVLVVGLMHAPNKELIASPLIGRSAPEFTLPNLNAGDAPVSAAMLHGGWHLVNIWGTWCFECRAEHGELLQIAKAGQVPIIGIDWKDTNADAEQWLTVLGNPYAAVGTDQDGRVAIDWGVYGAPESFLVDPQGKVVEKLVGPMSAELWQDKFLPHLNPAAGGKS
jgi:cytochrome c biogenesis protein CcmG, thiol:disulfide interchange protein DsbE